MAVRISELPLTTSMTGDDLVIVVDTPASGTTKRITFNDFMKEVYTPVTFTSNVVVSGDLTVSTNTVFSNLHISDDTTPSSSFWPSAKGKVWFDNNYLYVAVDVNTVKRVALSSF